MEYLSKREFNLRFLWELQRYPPKVARDLFRECRNDIRREGWWYTQRRWAKFIGLDKEEGICPPGEKEEERPVDLSYFNIEEGERILAVWRQEGKTAISLSRGLRCLDLEKFLSWPTNSEHVKAVKYWADSQSLAGRIS